MDHDVIPTATTLSPRIRAVSIDRPWVWLSRGWSDFIRAPGICLTYGIGLVLISFALTAGLFLAGFSYLVLPLAAGFMLVAPVLAVGIYEVSRRLEQGEIPRLTDAALAWRRNALQIAFAGLVLMFFHLAWIRIATLLFDIFFLTEGGLPFLVLGSAIGGILAIGVFAISAVSIPMLLDRDIDLITAMATSVTVVLINWRPMMLWAALILIFAGLGLATLYLGLAVALPLIALASWHSYRDLVEYPLGQPVGERRQDRGVDQAEDRSRAAS